jgi:hypothetical protein
MHASGLVTYIFRISSMYTSGREPTINAISISPTNRAVVSYQQSTISNSIQNKMSLLHSYHKVSMILVGIGLKITRDVTTI